jgi:ribose transport system permease protein
MLPSFLGPVLGGTLLAGGAVAVLGTFIGTMMTLVIRQGLSVQGIGLETLNIALGLVLLAALSVGQIQKMFTSFKLRVKK